MFNIFGRRKSVEVDVDYRAVELRVLAHYAPLMADYETARQEVQVAQRLFDEATGEAVEVAALRLQTALAQERSLLRQLRNIYGIPTNSKSLPWLAKEVT